MLALVFHHRDKAAAFAALLLAGLLVLLQGVFVLHQLATHPPMQVRLVDLPKPVVPPPPPPKPEPMPPTPPHLVTPHVPRQPVSPAPVTPSPVPMPSSVVAATPSPVQAPVTASAAPAAPPAPQGPTEDLAGEEAFAAGVRASIEEQKTYPMAARQMGMSGTVDIRYVISRSGKLLSAEVAESSGSPLLDRAALRAVQQASFNPMKAGFWPGQAQKEFHTKVVFKLVD